jgi:hypothetical protein
MEGEDGVDVDPDLELFEQKAHFYRGRAKIDIQRLRDEEGVNEPTRTIDEQNVVRLHQVYELDDCLRLDPDHFVPALVDPPLLREALTLSQLQQRDLLGYNEPKHLDIPIGGQVRILHGRHRLLAAERSLLPGDKWWVVELYDHGQCNEQEADSLTADHIHL